MTFYTKRRNLVLRGASAPRLLLVLFTLRENRSPSLTFLALLIFACVATMPAMAQDYLLFCNQPERMKIPGAYATAKLAAGKSYTIFYHYNNVSGESGPFVVGLRNAQGGPLRLVARQGLADAQRDPARAGRQAMARYLSAPENQLVGTKGFAQFAYPLQPGQIASGILTVECESDALLRIYFRHDRWDVAHSEVNPMENPRRDIDIILANEGDEEHYRIGQPEPAIKRNLDGAYGMMYRFKIAAPEGWKVRVAFSPRGGHGALVGSVDGNLKQTPMIAASQWRVFYEGVSGANGISLTTAPFGGIAYPVEMHFRLTRPSAKEEKAYWDRVAALSRLLPSRKISSGSTVPVIVR